MSENQSILVVGGAGYLGCVLVEELLNRGYAVTVFDRLFFGDGGLRKMRDRIRLISGDMRAMPPAVLENTGALINLGGLSNDPTAEYNPDANHQMNAVATRTLAEMAKKAGIRRYLYASSCSIYDVGVVDEERDILLTEETAVAPHAAYAVSKLAGEQQLMALGDANFCPVSLRTLFGFSPRMRYDLVVNTFVKDALSKGAVTLHYGGQMWRPLAEVRGRHGLLLVSRGWGSAAVRRRPDEKIFVVAVVSGRRPIGDSHRVSPVFRARPARRQPGAAARSRASKSP
jgi:nucleoside-diphosphate-sugar epimerase